MKRDLVRLFNTLKKMNVEKDLLKIAKKISLIKDSDFLEKKEISIYILQFALFSIDSLDVLISIIKKGQEILDLEDIQESDADDGEFENLKHQRARSLGRRRKSLKEKKRGLPDVKETHKKDIKQVYQFMEEKDPSASMWYDDFRSYMKDEVFDGDDSGIEAKVFYAALAATSQQKTPKLNFELTLQAFENMPAYFQTGSDKLIGERSDVDFIRELGTVQTAKSNLLSGLTRQIVHGPKIGNFYKNLLGQTQFVTLDVHMFDFLYKTKKGKRVSETPRQTNFGWNIFMQAAADLNVPPSNLQAAVWVFRYMYERNRSTDGNYIQFAEEKKQRLISVVNKIKELYGAPF